MTNYYSILVNVNLACSKYVDLLGIVGMDSNEWKCKPSNFNGKSYLFRKWRDNTSQDLKLMSSLIKDLEAVSRFHESISALGKLDGSIEIHLIKENDLHSLEYSKDILAIISRCKISVCVFFDK